jgi:hypothetical protein
VALIVLLSAQGSPGVTTSALGLALTWPRPVLLVDADPTGASAVPAGYFHGELDLDTGLVDLAVSHRYGVLAEDLPRAAMRIPGTSVEFLPGARSHAQARTLIPLWEPLTDLLASLEPTGQDVIVDAGRAGLTGSPEPLITGSDLTLLTVRSTLPALVGAKSWADTLRVQFDDQGAAGNLGLLLIGPGQPYTAREVAQVLQIPVVAVLAWDPVTAEVYSRGVPPSRRFTSSALVRSLNAAGAAIRSTLAAHQDELGVPAAAGGDT